MSGSYSNIDNIEWNKGRSIDHSSTNYVIVGVRHYATSQSRVDGLMTHKYPNIFSLMLT